MLLALKYKIEKLPVFALCTKDRGFARLTGEEGRLPGRSLKKNVKLVTDFGQVKY